MFLSLSASVCGVVIIAIPSGSAILGASTCCHRAATRSNASTEWVVQDGDDLASTSTSTPRRKYGRCINVELNFMIYRALHPHTAAPAALL